MTNHVCSLRRARSPAGWGVLPAACALAASWQANGAGADTRCHIQQLAQLPVTMLEMRPLVPGKINGEDAMFLADSGAFWSVLTPGAAKDYRLHTDPPPSSLEVRGVNGEIDVRVATVHRFVLGKIPVDNIQFLVGGSQIGAGAAGAIGQNVLRMANVEYDLANGAIRLMRTKGCDGVSLAYWQDSEAYSEIEISYSTALDPGTIGSAYLNGKKISVEFDTGSPSSVVSRRAAERAGVGLSAAGVVDGGYSGGGGRRSYRTWIVPVTSFKIGNEEIRKTRLRVADFSTETDMLLGADFFLSHRIYVANDRRKLYFTYNGGPVFNLATGRTFDVAASDDAAPPASGDSAGGAAAPLDAAGYARRGTAFTARREYERAIADLTRATTMAPEDASYQHQLGLAFYHNRQPIPALAALDRSLTLKRDDPQVLETRARVRLYGGDSVGAREDVDAADVLLPRGSDLRRDLAEIDFRLERYDETVRQLDAWLAAHEKDSGVGSALNSRCRARAMWNHDLPAALADCNGAIQRSPKEAWFLDSRGLVRVRLGDYAKAISDYDAALVLDASDGWALYGRSIAKRRLGRIDDAKADFDAAVAADPDIVKRASKAGIVP